MSSLGSNARKRGDIAGAINWYGKAYDASTGSTTRLEWGLRYVRALLELTPQDAHRIELAVAAVLGELEAKPETFHGRSSNALSALGRRVREWSDTSGEAEVLGRLREQMEGVCARLPAGVSERSACGRVFTSKDGAAT
jgi:hypothetical protein